MQTYNHAIMPGAAPCPPSDLSRKAHQSPPESFLLPPPIPQARYHDGKGRIGPRSSAVQLLKSSRNKANTDWSFSYAWVHPHLMRRSRGFLQIRVPGELGKLAAGESRPASWRSYSGKSIYFFFFPLFVLNLKKHCKIWLRGTTSQHFLSFHCTEKDLGAPGSPKYSESCSTRCLISNWIALYVLINWI